MLTDQNIEAELSYAYLHLSEQRERLSYSLAVPHYDKLRLEEVASPRLLVLLRLPPNPEEWLNITEDALIAKRCAYWLSLRGAVVSENDKTQTVYVPRENLLSPMGLTELMVRFCFDQMVTVRMWPSPRPGPAQSRHQNLTRRMRSGWTRRYSTLRRLLQPV